MRAGLPRGVRWHCIVHAMTEPNTETLAGISPVQDIVNELRAGRIVILVDDEDRENEGDMMMAADFVTPEAINFMATHARGLICLTLTAKRCAQLGLELMSTNNSSRYGTAFTTSIEAAEGVTTGISAADRARTVRVAVAANAQPSDIAQPGHIFPVRAVPGGVLMRAGHTEAGCDLARMAGCTPATVICEVMNEDGTMARLPDLQRIAAKHNLKIGTIADLIEYRSRTESLIEKIAQRPMQTMHGTFEAHMWRDKPLGALHMALTLGQWQPGEAVPVRVHEPLSALDALEAHRTLHSWCLNEALARIQQEGRGIAVLLNCGESAAQLQAQFEGTARTNPGPARLDLRSYGVGAQILRELGVQRMQLMGTPRRLPSITAGFGLEIAGYIERPQQ